MPINPQRDPSKSRAGKVEADQKAKEKAKDADELLREQSKTETEERPYLDTEGGE